MNSIPHRLVQISSGLKPFRKRKGFASLNVMLGAMWSVVTLPFRLIAWVVELCGRLVAFVLAFVLMVVGMALGAGPFFMLGVPLFIVGLILLLRCLR